jgi:hypothetical protein
MPSKSNKHHQTPKEDEKTNRKKARWGCFFHWPLRRPAACAFGTQEPWVL